jgi:hypothetical protein
MEDKMADSSEISILEADEKESIGEACPVQLEPSETSEVGALGSTWLTPGSYLLREIAFRPGVLAIVERVEPERHCVTVALERDPEDLLDTIFESERRMFAIFRGLPFDLRVTVVGRDTDALESILGSGFVHFGRA